MKTGELAVWCGGTDQPIRRKECYLLNPSQHSVPDYPQSPDGSGWNKSSDVHHRSSHPGEKCDRLYQGCVGRDGASAALATGSNRTPRTVRSSGSLFDTNDREGDYERPNKRQCPPDQLAGLFKRMAYKPNRPAGKPAEAAKALIWPFAKPRPRLFSLVLSGLRHF